MARYAARLMEQVAHLAVTPLRLLLTRRGSGERNGTGAQAAQRKETGVKGARILVVEARYYDDIADMLLRGAKARC